MIRNSLAAGAIALATVLAPTAAAFAFEAPTAAEFFGRFNVPESISVDVQGDGSVLISAPAGRNGWTSFSLRSDEVPAVGSRSVSIEVTIVEDGGGWPEGLTGFGIVQGYEGSELPFSVGVVSPQDGGTLRIGSYNPGSGFNIPQSLGGGMGVGETVTLTMTEQGSSLAFAVENGGSSSSTSTSNGLIADAMTGDNQVGFIIVGGGSYRIANLVIEDAN